MRHIVLALGLAATSLLATPAAAREASRHVSHADLDLSRPGDLAVLKQRIARALEAVCGSYATAEPAQAPHIDRCRADAQARASEQVAYLAEKARRALAAR